MEIAICIILVLLPIAYLIYNDRSNDDTRKNSVEKRFEYLNDAIIKSSKARRDKEERDKKEAERLERYKKYREGKPPTYEEWKAAKEAEEQENR